MAFTTALCVLSSSSSPGDDTVNGPRRRGCDCVKERLWVLSFGGCMSCKFLGLSQSHFSSSATWTLLLLPSYGVIKDIDKDGR